MKLVNKRNKLILNFLRNEELTQTEIAAKTGLSQSTVSRHLKELVLGNYLKTKEDIDGRFKIYKITEKGKEDKK